MKPIEPEVYESLFLSYEREYGNYCNFCNDLKNTLNTQSSCVLCLGSIYAIQQKQYFVVN